MGHYRVGEFDAPAGEVARLAAQADVIAGREQAALAAVGIPADGLGIEIGCGPGFVAAGLARSRPGLRLFGFDIDAYVLAEARKRLPAIRGDANHLPFADASFDLVSSRLFLRHVSDPLHVAREMARLVRPGGCLAAIDGSDASLLMDPVPADFAVITEGRRAWFDTRGATADMGHKLPGLWQHAGLTDIRVQAVVVDSRTIGLPAFAEIVLTPFLQAAAESAERTRYEAAASALQAWGRDPASFGSITLFVVGGRKN